LIGLAISNTIDPRIFQNQTGMMLLVVYGGFVFCVQRHHLSAD